MATLKRWNGTSWDYVGGVLGPKGDKGDTGATGPKGDPGPAGTVPANTATTDTAQVITGVKTFRPGTLLISNADGSLTSEPYSDMNAPGTFERTIVAAPSTNPPAGESYEYTTDGKSLDMRAPDGTVTRIGPAAGGGASDPLLLATDHATTTPNAPATGLSVFTRHRTRRLLATVGPSGQDTSYQPAMFANRIARVTVINNTAVPIYDGIAVTAYAAAPALQANASTNFFNSMVRNRYSSTATAGTIGGFRSATTQWFMSSTPNLGGFFFVCRFGLGVITTTNRVFVGLRTGAASTQSAAEAAIANGTQPSTLTNCIGFGADSADTSFYFQHNDATGAATRIALGANFPAQTAGTNFYEVRMFAPSGGGQNVRWSITRLNDGVFTQGQVTTDLPALGTMLAAHVTHSNGTTGAVASLDLQSLYVETDN